MALTRRRNDHVNLRLLLLKIGVIYTLLRVLAAVLAKNVPLFFPFFCYYSRVNLRKRPVFSAFKYLLY